MNYSKLCRICGEYDDSDCNAYSYIVIPKTNKYMTLCADCACHMIDKLIDELTLPDEAEQVMKDAILELMVERGLADMDET